MCEQCLKEALCNNSSEMHTPSACSLETTDLCGHNSQRDNQHVQRTLFDRSAAHHAALTTQWHQVDATRGASAQRSMGMQDSKSCATTAAATQGWAEEAGRAAPSD